MMTKAHNFIEVSLEELMEDRFGKYAKYIILDRALPDVRDGLKPVQRRILYAMAVDGNVPSKAYRKSAKTVGLVIGNYHPHGDSSVYDAMIRMSQSWKNNEILIDVQGNNGSIDDDPAAAMRYTEARLSPYGHQLMDYINENTVDFASNFDDSEQEPTVLPAPLPNLLVNGSTGIAAGYATNIPPHNLGEVIDALILKITNPKATLAQIMDLLPGPDFPTGGIAVNKDEIKKYFETGKGKLTLRAKIERISRKTIQQLIITEIPYEVVKANMVRKIVDLINNKAIDGFVDVRDESDRSGLRVVVDIKPEADLDVMEELLYRHTDAQVYYHVNMVGIVKRRPTFLNISETLDVIVAHQKDVLTKMALYRIEKLSKRIHIVEGLIKAISILDEIIAMIRASKDKGDAKEKLISAYAFSETQAEAIVSLRLYRLTNTDIVALRDEFAIGVNEIAYYESLLESETLLNNLLIENYRKLKAAYPQARQTELVDEVEEVVIEKTDLIADERVYVTVSEDGYLKRVSLRSYKASTGLSGYKENDRPIGEAECNLLDTLILILADGYFAYVPVFEINEVRFRDIGDHFSSLVNHKDNRKVKGAFIVSDFDSDVNLVTVTKNGMIKQTPISEFQMTRYSRTSLAMNVAKKDEIVAAYTAFDEDVGILTKSGYMVIYNVDQVPSTGLRSKGVRALNLETKDEVVDSVVFDTNDEFALIITQQETAKRVRIHEIRKGNRPYKGDLIAKPVKSNPAYMIKLFSGTSGSGVDVLHDSENKLWFKDVPIKSKDTTFSNLNLKGFMSIKNLSFVDVIKKPEAPQSDPAPAESDKVEMMTLDIDWFKRIR